jgi:hypothetical protein
LTPAFFSRLRWAAPIRTPTAILPLTVVVRFPSVRVARCDFLRVALVTSRRMETLHLPTQTTVALPWRRLLAAERIRGCAGVVGLRTGGTTTATVALAAPKPPR